MWVSRRRWRAMEQKLAELEKVEALYRQQVEFLTTSHNRLEAERAILIQRLFGLNLPVAEMAAHPRHTGGVGVAGQPLEDEREPVAGIDAGILTLGAAAFEDMGDEEAERQKVRSEVVVALR